jgi:hypothetical protein
LKRRSCLYFLVFMLCFLPAYLHAQCLRQKRTYADYQGSLRTGLSALGIPVLDGVASGTIINANNAINGVPTDASTIAVAVGALGTASATQFLGFTTGSATPVARVFPANTPVTVKFGLPVEILSVLSGIEIGSFVNLHDVPANFPTLALSGNYAGQDAGRTVIYNSANIAGVLSGSGEVELTLTPAQAFSGIYIKVAGNVLSVALSAKVYHAYIMEQSVPMGCDDVIDVLSGVEPSVVGGVANLTAGVSNPFSAIDNNIETYATLNLGLSVLNKVYISPIYSNPSQPGDQVSVILSNPGGLLSLNLLTGFVIQPYFQGVKAGPAFNSSSTFLTLSLLAAGSDKYVLSFPVNTPYDRIEIAAGGLLGALGTIQVHEVIRKPAKPASINLVGDKYEQTICQGSSATFTIDHLQSCTEYKWYNAETSGNLVGSGASFTTLNTLAAGTYNYYVKAIKTYCATEISDPLKVTLVVNPSPPLSIPAKTICAGSTALLEISDSDVTKYDYVWYDAPTGGNIVVDKQATFTTPTLTANRDYYVVATDKVTGCSTGATRIVAKVMVKQFAAVPAISGNSTMCASTTQTLANSYPGGTWSSSDETIATVDATGKVMALTSGNVVISYTVADDATYCGKKVDFNLTVNPQPNLTLEPDPGICEGLTSTTITYSNAVYGPITYSISWTDNLLPAVSNQTLAPNEITITIPSTTPFAVYQGVLTIKNANDCTRAIPFNFRVKLVPHKPTVSIN